MALFAIRDELELELKLNIFNLWSNVLHVIPIEKCDNWRLDIGKQINITHNAVVKWIMPCRGMTNES